MADADRGGADALMGQGPLSTTAEVLAVRRQGAHTLLTLDVGQMAEAWRPGQFVSARHPDPTRLVRFSVPIGRASGPGLRPGSVEIIVGPGDASSGLAARWAPGEQVDLLGPLGRPFALPKEPVPCVLVGVGHHAATLFGLVDRLARRDCPVHLLFGGRDDTDVVASHELRRDIRSLTVATDDGSMGQHASVDVALPEVLSRTGAAVVYVAAPPEVLHAVAVVAEESGAWCQAALPLAHPCGTGLCAGCPVPVVGEDGVARTVRSCSEGPVFRGDRVRWADFVAGVLT